MALETQTSDPNSRSSTATPLASGASAILDKMPLHKYLTYRLSRVQAKLNAQGAHLLKETAGLTLSQWRVIALVGAAGETRLSDLSRDAAMDKGLLSRNVKGLVTSGILSSTPSDQDHRVQNLRLTSKGQTVFQKTLPKTRVRQDWLRADLSDQEVRLFETILDKLELAANRRDF